MWQISEEKAPRQGRNIHMHVSQAGYLQPACSGGAEFAAWLQAPEQPHFPYTSQDHTTKLL